MDADWAIMTLQDTADALADLIAEIEADPEAAGELLEESMPAIFAKLNYAWNSRRLGPRAIDTVDHNELVGWPRDLQL